MRVSPSVLDKCRQTALAACVATTFSVTAPAAVIGNTWVVTTCADSGAGSLRAIVGAVGTQPGDTVDLSQLTAASPGCVNAQFPLFPATISLTTGSIAINQEGLILLGPGSDKLLIVRPSTGATTDRLVTHLGTGDLNVSGLSLSGGYAFGFLFNTYGGCLASQGNLVIDDVHASACKAVVDYDNHNGSPAYGGAFYAKGTLTMSNSTLTGNVASTPRTLQAEGGAIFARGTITLSTSQLTENQAIGNTSGFDLAGSVHGGAVAGKSDVTIVTSTLDHNSATTTSCYCPGGLPYSYTAGGAIFANGQVTLTNAVLSNNSAIVFDNSGNIAGALYGSSAGGGVLSTGKFAATDSVITGNLARAPANSNKKYFNQHGGGVQAKAGVSIAGSTISGNSAGGSVSNGFGVGGGLFAYATLSDPPNEVDNTTISGNSATIVGGAYVVLPAAIKNSTIAFNTAVASEFPMAGDYAPGLMVAGNGKMATLVGTLISNNTTPIVNSSTNSTEDDLSTVGAPDFKSTSANNLVRLSNNAVKTLLPNDTIALSCPLLGPLRDNGGPTPTHALMSHSPAIDVGNAGGLTDDQRGPSYVRPSGVGADIGAYEVQQDEVVFTSDLEGCP